MTAPCRHAALPRCLVALLPRCLAAFQSKASNEDPRTWTPCDCRQPKRVLSGAPPPAAAGLPATHKSRGQACPRLSRRRRDDRCRRGRERSIVSQCTGWKPGPHRERPLRRFAARYALPGFSTVQPCEVSCASICSSVLAPGSGSLFSLITAPDSYSSAFLAIHS